MKRAVLVVFCIIALCSLGLAMNTGTVRAYQTGYEVNDYMVITIPTMDGNWTTTNEWTDAEERQLDGSLNVTFKLKYDSSQYPTAIFQYYLIEFFDDTTNSTGDYWQICYEAPPEVPGTPIGGTTPQTDCYRWDFVGHDVDGFEFYQGNGTAWVTSSDYNWETDIYIVDSFGTSPLSDTPHWIVEIMIEHVHYNIGIPQWIRIAAYDANNTDAGVQAWPDSDVDVPNDWGLSTALQEQIPEALNIGVMVLLSSVSVLIGSHYFRKRSSSGKQKK